MSYVAEGLDINGLLDELLPQEEGENGNLFKFVFIFYKLVFAQKS